MKLLNFFASRQRLEYDPLIDAKIAKERAKIEQTLPAVREGLQIVSSTSNVMRNMAGMVQIVSGRGDDD